MTSNPLDERRQRAREAAHDENGDPYRVDRYAVEAAIETATRVKIDDEIIQAVRPGVEPGSVMWVRTRAKLARGFAAAGFEVEC